MRQHNGDQRELSTRIPSPLVAPGLNVTNHLRVVASGDRFQFYINGARVPLCIPNQPDGKSTYDEDAKACLDGKLLDTLVDTTIPSGQVGVAAQSFETAGVVVNFDNLAVFGPDPALFQANTTRE
jgi:hypothetical protein